MAKPTPVEYAERTLGVHDVYREAVEAAEGLTKALDDRHTASNGIRDLTEALGQAEADLSVRERAANSEMSATAFDRHMKVAAQNDPDLQDLRHGLAQARASYDGADSRVKQYDTRVRIATARMEELSGYFHYLAVAKSTASRRQRRSEASEASEAEST